MTPPPSILDNAWTGGQYSLVRGLLGLWTILAATALAITLGGWAWATLPVLAGAGAALALGWHDRVAAAVLIAGLVAIALLAGGPPLDAPLPAWPWALVAALLAHLLVPARPYGSITARGRLDPAGGWRITAGAWAGVWGVVALAHLGAGLWMATQEPWRLGEALFHDGQGLALPDAAGRVLTWLLVGAWLALAPLALTRTTRPVGWAAAALTSLIVLPLAGHGALALAMVPLYLMSFDPTWVRPRDPQARETLFYDGHCGLCHGFVRFVLAEDQSGQSLIFAALQGERFGELVPASQRDALPDSVVLARADGALLVRSAATLHVLARLGGLWRLLAAGAALIPSPVRDAIYDGIAAVRHRLFAPPPEACPMLPPELRQRFAG